MPSTIANIMDLLSDWKRVVENNDDISFFYILYQVMMMVGTVLGPGQKLGLIRFCYYFDQFYFNK